VSPTIAKSPIPAQNAPEKSSISPRKRFSLSRSPTKNRQQDGQREAALRRVNSIKQGKVETQKSQSILRSHSSKWLTRSDTAGTGSPQRRAGSASPKRGSRGRAGSSIRASSLSGVSSSDDYDPTRDASVSPQPLSRALTLPFSFAERDRRPYDFVQNSRSAIDTSPRRYIFESAFEIQIF